MALLDEYQVGVDGPWDDGAAGHLYRRAAFGSLPAERAAAVGAGTQQAMRDAVDALVDFQALDPHLDVSAGVVDPTFGDPIPDLPDSATLDDIVGLVLAGVKNPQDIFALQGHWLYRMRHTSQPLQEQLSLFLHDHMVSEYQKVVDLIPAFVTLGNDGSVPLQLCTSGTLGLDVFRQVKMAVAMAKDQNYLYRTTGADSFRELLINVTRDPFMLLYLDNVVNIKGAAQENYAREVMELFSMGVGNYSEQDIREIAKCLTGETLQYWLRGYDVACANDYSTDWGFVPEIHEEGNKFVFGTTINEDMTGQETVEVIDLILGRTSVNPNAAQFGPGYTDLPATAVYMSWKLLTWFVNHDIKLLPQPDPIVLELADYLRGTDNGAYPQRRFPFDLRAALRKLFLSRYFHDPANVLVMHKNPAEYVVSALRGLGIDDFYTFQQGTPVYLSLMGMELFNPPNVAGWNHGHAWTTTGNIILRSFYALRVAYDLIDNGDDYGKAVMQTFLVANGGTVIDYDDNEGIVDALSDRLLAGIMTTQERQAILDALVEIKALAPLPGFAETVYYFKFQAAIFLIMTMPRFQLK